MTLPASSEPFGDRLPSKDERFAAKQLRQILAAHSDGATLQVLQEQKPVEITLSPQMSDLLLNLLRHISNGNAVTLIPIHEMLTTQQAADILNVSRPHLIKLLEQGQIDHSKVGRHRRLKAEDVFAYKRARDDRRSNALDALMAEDSELI